MKLHKITITTGNHSDRLSMLFRKDRWLRSFFEIFDIKRLSDLDGKTIEELQGHGLSDEDIETVTKTLGRFITIDEIDDDVPTIEDLIEGDHPAA